MKNDNQYIEWQNKNISNCANPLSHAGSNGASDGTVYHQQTLKVLQDNGFNDKSTILDYGCGCGALYSVVRKYLSDPESQYFGNEMSSEAYAVLSQIFSSKNFFLSKSDLISDFTEQIFDYLVAFSVFNHMSIDRFEHFIQNLDHNIHEQSKFLFTVRLITEDTIKIRGQLSNCGKYYNDRGLNYGYKADEFYKILELYEYNYTVINKDRYYEKGILRDLDLILITKMQ